MTTSDRQAGHVSMFDQLPDGGFRTELRGYDKAEVELKIRELEFANSHRDQMIHELEELSDRLRDELTEATSVSRETEQPSYSGLGARVEHLLRLAEEQASNMVARAEAEADKQVLRLRHELAEATLALQEATKL